MRRFLFTLASFLVTSLVGAENTARRPNILLLTADDLGLQLGCYGDSVATTPHLDRLAAEGVRFTRGFVTQASCSPSRSSILTGLFPHQNGQIGLAHLGYEMHGSDIPTAPRELRRRGYFTGIFGKLHVQPTAAFPFEFSETHYENARDPAKVADGFARFLRRAEARPFFYMLNLTDPHVPFRREVNGAPATKVEARDLRAFPFMATETADSVRDAMANYYTCVNRADECVGRVLDLLESSGLARDTLVIFVGDHGPPFPRAKVTLHRAGVHIPFLVRWPAQQTAPRVEHAFVSTIDLLPTLLDLVGGDTLPGLPGRSLLPLLRGPVTDWRQSVETEFTSHEPGQFLPQRAIERGRFRLVLSLLHDPGLPLASALGRAAPAEVFERFASVPHVALFDLENDPAETRNLADGARYAAERDELIAELESWRRRTADPYVHAETLLADAKREAERGVAYQRQRTAPRR